MTPAERILREEERTHELSNRVRAIKDWTISATNQLPASVHIEIRLADGTFFRKNLVHRADGSAALSDEYSYGPEDPGVRHDLSLRS